MQVTTHLNKVKIILSKLPNDNVYYWAVLQNKKFFAASSDKGSPIMLLQQGHQPTCDKNNGADQL